MTIVTNDNCKALFDMVHDMRSDAYFIDEGLAAKFRGIFEDPEDGEMDLVIK